MGAGITKWLDVTPATKDTTLSGAGRRWNSVSKVQAISKLNTLLHVPAFSLDFNNVLGASLIVAQYNYIAPQAFSLIEFPFSSIDIVSPEVLCFMAIRYRVGEEVFRRVLYNKVGFVNINDCQFYNGEIIEPNFVIEFWSKGFQSVNPETIKLLNDLYLKTSILNIPSGVESLASYIEPSIPLFTNLFLALPQNMPLPAMDANGPWITN